MADAHRRGSKARRIGRRSVRRAAKAKSAYGRNPKKRKRTLREKWPSPGKVIPLSIGVSDGGETLAVTIAEYVSEKRGAP